MAVITFSRKIGSFGGKIAEAAAQRLQYRFVRPEDIHELGMSLDPKFKEACSRFETELPRGLMERYFFTDQAFTSLFEALNFQLAAEDNVIIQGRGAQIVLAEYPGILKVRCVAPTDVRIDRVKDREQLTLEQAAERVHKYDVQRKSLIEHIFGRDLSDWSLYDLVINTENLSVEAAVEMVLLGLDSIKKPDDLALWKENFRNLAFARLVESTIKQQVWTAPHRDISVTSPGGGVVVIEGVVPDKKSRERVGRIALAYPGVKDIENRLKTTELSF